MLWRPAVDDGAAIDPASRTGRATAAWGGDRERHPLVWGGGSGTTASTARVGSGMTAAVAAPGPTTRVTSLRNRGSVPDGRTAASVRGSDQAFAGVLLLQLRDGGVRLVEMVGTLCDAQGQEPGECSNEVPRSN